MDALTCPKCGGPMSEQRPRGVRVHRCDQCQSLFLDRADLGALVEGEQDWHSARSTDTARLPRITPDMTAPPPAPRAAAYVETLFGG